MPTIVPLGSVNLPRSKPNIVSRIVGAIAGVAMAGINAILTIPYEFGRNLRQNLKNGEGPLGVARALAGMVINIPSQALRLFLSGDIEKHPGSIGRYIARGWNDGLLATLKTPYLIYLNQKVIEANWDYDNLPVGSPVRLKAQKEIIAAMEAHIKFYQENYPESIKTEYDVDSQLGDDGIANAKKTLDILRSNVAVAEENIRSRTTMPNIQAAIINSPQYQDINPVQASCDLLLKRIDELNMNKTPSDKVFLSDDQMIEARSLSLNKPDKLTEKEWNEFKNYFDSYEKSICPVSFTDLKDIKKPICTKFNTYELEALKEYIKSCEKEKKIPRDPMTMADEALKPENLFAGISDSEMKLIENIREVIKKCTPPKVEISEKVTSEPPAQPSPF